MITREDYKQAKAIINKYESEHLNISDVSESFNEDKMKVIVPYYIVDTKMFCNELRFIVKRFLKQNPEYLHKVSRLINSR